MKKLFKVLAIGLQLIPIGMLLLFTIGETASDDLSGLSHLIQLIPLLIIVSIAIYRPLIGGILLIVISTILGILYPILAPFNFSTILSVEAILFLPPFIAGILLVISERMIKNEGSIIKIEK